MITRLKIWIGMSFVDHLKTKGFSVVPTLIWTFKQPIIPGWYWVRSKRLSPRVEKFYEATYGVKSINPISWPYIDRGEVMEYAGPIATPESAE